MGVFPAPLVALRFAPKRMLTMIIGPIACGYQCIVGGTAGTEMSASRLSGPARNILACLSAAVMECLQLV